MGVDAPPLVPTDSSLLESPSAEHRDLASDLSRRTDRSSYSIPDDGSPITISTRRKRHDRERESDSSLTHPSHHSQTSLLIEYFEGGKTGDKVSSRPSVRVKVTPSAARKIKDARDHIQISETGRTRQASYSKRISLSPRLDKNVVESADDRSLSSYASATEESIRPPRGPPVEIEVMHRDDSHSASSSPRDRRHVLPNPSEISSMPPDSVLEPPTGTRTPRRDRDRSRSRTRHDVSTATATLKTPSRRRSRSLSRERIAQKVIEKLAHKSPKSPNSPEPSSDQAQASEQEPQPHRQQRAR